MTPYLLKATFTATDPTSVGFLLEGACDKFHNVVQLLAPQTLTYQGCAAVMEEILLPVLLFVIAAAAVGIGMLTIASLLGPSRQGRVKAMPYESGMDPIHDTKRRFDVRFHLVAIAFLLFDVEILFLYPWAVAGHPEAPGSGRGFELLQGAVPKAQEVAVNDFRLIVFGGAMLFLVLVVAGLVYEWRRGVLRWR